MLYCNVYDFMYPAKLCLNKTVLVITFIFRIYQSHYYYYSLQLFTI